MIDIRIQGGKIRVAGSFDLGYMGRYDADKIHLYDQPDRLRRWDVAVSRLGPDCTDGALSACLTEYFNAFEEKIHNNQKQVNDNFGHATGDLVLKAIASNLHHIFKGAGTVGRIGGDEFAVIIEAPLSPQELGQRLERFLSAIADTLPDKKTSCSIGAYQFVFPQSVKHLLSETDQILYKAKENGRACYVLKECGWQAGNGKREDLV